MSVLIDCMEMPTRCCECRLSTCHSFKERPLCDVLVEYMSYGEWEAKRLDNCPLVQVPPHGRLIDADAVTLECGPYEYDDWCATCIHNYGDSCEFGERCMYQSNSVGTYDRDLPPTEYEEE